MKLAKIRGNPYVEFVHWIEQLTLTANGDFQKIAAHFGLEFSRLTSDLTASIDELPRGSSSVSDISEHIFDAMERSFAIGALHFSAQEVRSGHVLYATLVTPRLKPFLLNMSQEFAKIVPDDLEAGFPGIVAGSSEDGAGNSEKAGRSGAPAGELPSAEGETALSRYATNMTETASDGKMDPIVGRDEEIRQMVDILMRRRQNNPILTGEAGVGKTAVVEGFAQRLAKGDVPPSLQNVALYSLDIGLLQAGASMKGEFEERLKQVIEEVQSSEKPIILFMDEAHTLIGAGGAAGTGDAANLLKPALARGELRTIAATTWAEYKKHIEKDPALSRRFEVVKVEEPSEQKALDMIRGVCRSLEDHHQIQILDEAIVAAVQLSSRYVPARQLPDKAVALLDTACARVATSLHATPAEVEDLERRIASLQVEKEIIGREEAIGVDTKDRSEKVAVEQKESEALLKDATDRWKSEKALVSEILALQQQLQSGEITNGEAVSVELKENEKIRSSEAPGEESDDVAIDHTSLTLTLATKQAELQKVQNETPLVLPSVDRQAVATVLESWTGIPVSKMGADEIDLVLTLSERLAKRVIGQDHAMRMIAKRVQTSRAGLTAKEKPVGVFMLAGPSGTGKTETALALADTLYGGEQNLITINMSEFQEAHTVSTLKGAPPGYVGYGEGGVLTEAVRRRPYSVVLLDEVEKAHPDVHEMFFQVFDKGSMEDGEGRQIDFRNTLILLTSNVGSDLIMSLCDDPDLMPEPEALAKAIRPPLLEIFPAALLGRIVTIPFVPLSDTMVHEITKLKLSSIQKRVADTHGAALSYDEKVLELICARCAELESGGRMIDAILTNTMLPRISEEILGVMQRQETIKNITVTVEADEFHYAFETDAD